MSTSVKIATGAAAILLFPVLLAAAAGGAISSILGSGNTPSDAALADIPTDYLALYQHAAPLCPGLDWSILAAIGKIESDHGRSRLPGVAPGTVNHALAAGPMQFLQPTFDGVIARHTIPPGGQKPPSPWNKHDAIHAAMFYLCDNDAPDDLHKALFAYNHADWYVDKVLAQAAQYAQASPAPTDSAARAIAFARAQIGLPYVWGGNGPQDGDAGFDCSGLTAAAYASAGIQLPRTAHTQYHATTRVTQAELQPGDLVFYGNPTTKIHHVGLYLGNGQMIDAPTFGKPVGIHLIRYRGDDFAGGGRIT